MIEQLTVQLVTFMFFKKGQCFQLYVVSLSIYLFLSSFLINARFIYTTSMFENDQ